MSLNQNIYPLDNLQQFFSLFYLIQEAEGDFSFVSQCFNEMYDTSYDAVAINLLISKFLHLFRLEKTGLDDLFGKLKLMVTKKKQYLKAPIDKCIFCHLILISKPSLHKITAYCFDMPKEMFYKDQWCQRCDINFNFRNYTKCNSGESFLYPSDFGLSFLATSRETCFELKLLRYFDEQIIRNGVTFEGFCDSYNLLYADNLFEMRPLNRQRLSEAWYSFKIKQLILSDNNSLPLLDFKCDSKSTEKVLELKMPIWRDKFTVDWSLKHKKFCLIPNCDATGILFLTHMFVT